MPSEKLSAYTPFVIGIAGGTASGKTTVCKAITQALGDQQVVLLGLDEFYRDLTPEETANISEVNFDEPGAFDFATLLECLDSLRRCEATDVPVYDFVTSRRSLERTRRVKPAHVIVVEGILALASPEILERCYMRIFVDTDDDVRLVRRIKRDTVERGRKVEGVLSQYTRFVKPAFDRYVLPSKLKADIIIPWRDNNPVATELVTQHIRSKLQVQDLRRIYSNLHLLKSTMQTRGMHTKIRCRLTPRSDFVFYADRLIRLIVEMALGKLPFKECTVQTPSGDSYQGVDFCRKICGVSMIRSGEAMENALRACCLGIKLGKILIHRSGDSGQNIAYEKLPHDIAQRQVLLMDPILATGSCAVRAIEQLIKRRGVDEGKIILLTLIAAPRGIHRVCARFPKLQVITSEIDSETADDGSIRPGVGDFGDRYFGTTCASDEHLTLMSLQSSLPNSSDKASTVKEPSTLG
jgi:uridine kinase